MSKFFSGRHAALTPYTPGEQPQDMQYVKLNTNESPFPPSKGVLEAALREAGKLQLYSDPTSAVLGRKMAQHMGVAPEMVLMTNGSDEALYYAFMAFGDEQHPMVFPDITYGFYPVYADLFHIPYEEKPLAEDFSINPAEYIGAGKTVVIANPNAPTGRCLPLCVIEDIVKSNPENLVLIDEAYVDFGGESAVPLTLRYDNLLVVGTFSKSRSMAGARLGYAIGNPALIADMNTVKYSLNPYNVNRVTAAAGVAALEEDDYYRANCQTIMENREWTAQQLESLGFDVIPSKTNFLFARSAAVSGETLYLELKKRGVLVRHFTAERIREYNRITIGTREQMELFLEKTKEILKEANA
ncbi:MAG: histidinol-phosphate transaminase [Clostridiales bacterium]|nr:histidinol-phosphate transaminase [Clostridiales bacterium]